MAFTKYGKAVHRGDIFYVDRIAQYGHEQMAGRPAVVVSSEVNNTHSPTVEVAYLTTAPKANLPTHVKIYTTGKESTVLCEQITTVDAERLGDYLGTLSKADMEEIDDCLMASLGIIRDEQPTDLYNKWMAEKERADTLKAQCDDAYMVSEMYAKDHAELSIYKEMYENLLKMLMKGAK